MKIEYLFRFWTSWKGKTHKLQPRFDKSYQIINKLDSITNCVKRDKQIIVAHEQRLLKNQKWELKKRLGFNIHSYASMIKT